MPAGVDKVAYFFAPFLTLMLALTSLAIIPFGPDITIFGYTTNFGIADVNISLLVLFAITALGVYGIALAGWGSNSKYSLLGGLRSSAQMISYELALTLSVVGVLLIAGDLSLKHIVEKQAGDLGLLSWNIIGIRKDGTDFTQIIGCICFFIAAIAETNRVPFDLPEAESELVAGFHTEYASMKFAMFFIGEYTSMIAVSSLFTILFFGGWLSPFPASWTMTHYLPSIILVPLGLWVILDGIRYETVFGRVILPGLGAVFTALGIALFLSSTVNELIQQRHPIHSALSLILVMVALAGLYLLMGAEFIAAVQIIVYGGAVMVLFVFVIMLLNAGEEERTNFSRLATFGGIPLALALGGVIAAAIARSSGHLPPPAASGVMSSTKEISKLLFSEFVYPFELTSFLILVAILGAIVLAQREN